jgi:hypothetical protein
MSAIKKSNYSIFIPIVAIWLWGLRNNYLFYNLLQFLKFVLYWFPTKSRESRKKLDHWANWQKKNSAEDYTNMSYYNCCGIRPKHSNISNYNLCGIEIKIVAMLCFIGSRTIAPGQLPLTLFFNFIFSFWLPLSDSMNSIALLYFHFKIHSYLSQF